MPQFKFSFTLPKFGKEREGRTSTSDNEDNIPNPDAREVLASEGLSLEEAQTDPLPFDRGLVLLKGRVPSTAAATVGASQSDLVPGKYEGGFKLWECTTDLIETLRREIQDGRLSFRGKHVLELGCGHGLPGILACIKGAHRVHFQDFNAEVLTSLTIPNVAANLAQARSMPRRVSEVNVPTVSRTPSPAVEVKFFAGDWGDMPGLLSLVDKETAPEALHGREAFHPVSSFEDLAALENSAENILAQEQREQPRVDSTSSAASAHEAHSRRESVGEEPHSPAGLPGAVASTADSTGGSSGDSTGQDQVSTAKRSDREASVHQSGDSAVDGGAGHAPQHHASFARAASVDSIPQWTAQRSSFSEAGMSRRGSHVEEPKGGYDVILMAETVYSPACYAKLNQLIKKALRSPYGVVYLAAKKYYFGVGGGTRQFKAVLEEDGLMAGHLIAEFVDGVSNVREIWKFFYKTH